LPGDDIDDVPLGDVTLFHHPILLLHLLLFPLKGKLMLSCERLNAFITCWSAGLQGCSEDAPRMLRACSTALGDSLGDSPGFPSFLPFPGPDSSQDSLRDSFRDSRMILPGFQSSLFPRQPIPRLGSIILIIFPLFHFLLLLLLLLLL